MLLRAVYWVSVVCYVAALALLLIGGYLGARIRSDSLIVVGGVLLAVCLLYLGSSIAVFLRAKSPLWRVAALVMVAAPLIVAGSSIGVIKVSERLRKDKAGNDSYFPAGPLRDLGGAISLNDTPVVAALASKVNLNTRGERGMTLLASAVLQLEKTPHRLDVLDTLLKAGADPNLGADEYPLRIAIRLSHLTGREPVAMLLAAGANPNARDSFGEPIYFLGVEAAGPDVFQVLMDHGADLNAKGYLGRSILYMATDHRNWGAVTMLFKRGVDWRGCQSEKGVPFQKWVEELGTADEDRAAYKEVLEYLRRR